MSTYNFIAFLIQNVLEPAQKPMCPRKVSLTKKTLGMFSWVLSDESFAKDLRTAWNTSTPDTWVLEIHKKKNNSGGWTYQLLVTLVKEPQLLRVRIIE